MTHAIHETATRAGLKCQLHDLRHTYASHKAMAGVDLYTLKELLGHKDIKARRCILTCRPSISKRPPARAWREGIDGKISGRKKAMINFQPVDVCGKTIDHVWFQLLKQVLIYGRPYKKDEGSFAGEEMLELDRVSGTIFEPLQYNVSGIRKPLAVTVPGGVDAPTTDEYIEKYFVEYLMDSNLPQTEHYRYSTFITGGRYTLPKLDFLIPDRLSWYSLDEVIVKVPNQIQWCIDHYKTKGFHNNHCLIQLGYPESNLAYDKPFEDETERGTSPCLRLIDTKIVKDSDGEFYLCFYVTFRSWNLWGGWPTNIGGLALLMEYMAHELEVNPGPLSFNSKAMNIYKFQLNSLINRVGTVE